MSIDMATYNYVQFCGYQLFSDEGVEDGIAFSMLLGMNDDVHFDGTTGVITDNFDGKWASINGIPFFLHISEMGLEYNIYISPILLNDNDSNLILKRNRDANGMLTGHYEILGTWTAADPESGLASRNTGILAPGDRISPKHIYVFTEDILSEEEADTSKYMEYFGVWRFLPSDESITVTDQTRMLHEALKAGTYYYQFGIIDVFGRQLTYVPITFTIDENGVRITDGQ